MSEIDVSEWRQMDVITTASSRGFNPLQQIPIILKQKYPALRIMKFGFFTKEDRPARFIDGWRHLEPKHFPDYETFANAIGSRYGLILDSENHFMLKENYVMIMPDFHADKLKTMRESEAEREYKQKTENAPAIEGAQRGSTEVGFSETAQRIERPPDAKEPVKRGPGRPKEK